MIRLVRFGALVIGPVMAITFHANILFANPFKDVALRLCEIDYNFLTACPEILLLKEVAEPSPDEEETEGQLVTESRIPEVDAADVVPSQLLEQMDAIQLATLMAEVNDAFKYPREDLPPSLGDRAFDLRLRLDEIKEQFNDPTSAEGAPLSFYLSCFKKMKKTFKQQNGNLLVKRREEDRNPHLAPLGITDLGGGVVGFAGEFNEFGDIKKGIYTVDQGRAMFHPFTSKSCDPKPWSSTPKPCKVSIPERNMVVELEFHELDQEKEVDGQLPPFQSQNKKGEAKKVYANATVARAKGKPNKVTSGLKSEEVQKQAEILMADYLREGLQDSRRRFFADMKENPQMEGKSKAREPTPEEVKKKVKEVLAKLKEQVVGDGSIKERYKRGVIMDPHFDDFEKEIIERAALAALQGEIQQEHVQTVGEITQLISSYHQEPYKNMLNQCQDGLLEADAIKQAASMGFALDNKKQNRLAAEFLWIQDELKHMYLEKHLKKSIDPKTILDNSPFYQEPNHSGPNPDTIE